LLSAFSESIFDKISIEFKGVRSSCDMFAKNSDLYFEDSASCFALSSSAVRASSIWRFFCSTSLFVRREAGFFFELLIRLLKFFLLLFEQFFGSLQRLRLQFEPAVRFLQLGLPDLQFLSERLRLFEQFLGSHVRFDRVDNDPDRFGHLDRGTRIGFR
jgi:hypothetical protein